ncbi:hypothetical protein HDV00_009938 [Rhizophlyctis rosea]|nr:hypothetical protein HDV00_009938 [Rhizophlyctis rosea]
MHLLSSFPCTLALLASLCLPSSYAASAFGSADSSITAARSLVFLLEAPGNCLHVASDLPPNSPSMNMAALWIRAVFHDAAPFSTSDPKNSTVGLDGSLAYEFSRPDNAGIDYSIATRFRPSGETSISDADLIAIGGVVSITHCGGPSMKWRPGRQDGNGNGTRTANPDGRIPQADDSLDVVRAHFIRMGLNDIDMVVLTTGSHTMGGVHAAISPRFTNESFVPFDNTPGVFDNDIFKHVLAGRCALPIDCLFAKDPILKPHIQLWASDQDAFFAQYATSFEKMMNLTRSPLYPAVNLTAQIPVHQNLLAEGTNVVFPLAGVTYPGAINSTNSTNTQNKGATSGAASLLRPYGHGLGGNAGDCPWARLMSGMGMGAGTAAAVAAVGGVFGLGL